MFLMPFLHTEAHEFCTNIYITIITHILLEFGDIESL